MNNNSDILQKTYNIFLIIIKCFFLSCGISLLLFFFYDYTLEFTKNNIKNVVTSIFLILLVTSSFIRLFINQSLKYDSVDKISVPLPLETSKINKDNDSQKYKKRMIAIHEAGHAVMAYLRNADDIMVYASLNDSKVITSYAYGNKEDVKSMILVKYAGAISEEIILGNYNVGCFNGQESDFVSATELIKGYITMINPEISKTMLEKESEQQITEISKQFYKEAKEIINKNINIIEQLADKLLEKETLTTSEVKLFIDKIKKNS